ncbi:MAG: hypothetical protein WCR02_04645, partial [Sphaerochaetaceae bacterium]
MKKGPEKKGQVGKTNPPIEGRDNNSNVDFLRKHGKRNILMVLFFVIILVTSSCSAKKTATTTTEAKQPEKSTATVAKAPEPATVVAAPVAKAPEPAKTVVTPVATAPEAAKVVAAPVSSKYGSDCKVTTASDGTTIYTVDNGIVVDVAPKGNMRTSYLGTLISDEAITGLDLDAKGNRNLTYADGMKAVIASDGAVSVSLPNGILVSA